MSDRPQYLGSFSRVVVRSIYARERVTVASPTDQSAEFTTFVTQLALVFVAYFVAGKLGQATTSIRSSNLGPVWPAYGVAVAAILQFGARVSPALALSAFLVAAQSAVSPLTAAGQAASATLAAVSGAYALRRIDGFDPTLPRLRHAVALILVGAFGSALISSSLGILSLYATGVLPYSGVVSAWLIYWLGDSTGVLLITPLLFTLTDADHLMRRRPAQALALGAAVALSTFVIFGDLPLIPIRLHALAFAVLPFVMWAAIDFGVGGAAASVLAIATSATLLTALGHGPFATSTPFVNATLLDVLFTVLAVSGLILASAISERGRAEEDRLQLMRERAAVEERLRLAAIVESANDAIISVDLDGRIVNWNAAAERIFGYSAAEAIGQSSTVLIPQEQLDVEHAIRRRLSAGERIEHFETVRLAKDGRPVDVSLTVSPLYDAERKMIGAARVFRDISEQRQAREAILSVNRKLIAAQEQERARIARELHDNIAQRLALLTWKLSDADGKTPAMAAGLQQEVSDIAADVQALSHDLHSPKLELLGLEDTMRGFCRQFAEQMKMTVTFSADHIVEPPPDVSLSLFRVLQEALHNAAKHSASPCAEVRLWTTQDDVRLSVADQGVGFDVPSARGGRGMGLTSMDERLKLVGGELDIASSLRGGGTRLHARAPLLR